MGNLNEVSGQILGFERLFSFLVFTSLKGELQHKNKLISYGRVFKVLENDMNVAGIGQAVLELLSFKVGSGNLLTSEIFGNLW